MKPKGIDWKEIISSKLLPDEAIYVEKSKTLYVIEKKFQQGHGSVDEKIQTCGFKKQQYSKLVASLGIEVEYIYLLSDWFKKTKYKDTLEYIRSQGCYYYFNELPLEDLYLP